MRPNDPVPRRRRLDDLELTRAARGEEGFILLESLIAISLITVLMGALASFTLNVVTGTNELRARQGATQLATSTMATIGAVPATDLVTGRDSASVATQFSTAPASVAPWLATMTQASDGTATAGAGATSTIPTAATPQTLNSIAYSVSTYLGTCALRTAGSTAANDCVVSGAGTNQLRAVVAVTWSGRGCRPASCSYVTATLVNSGSDPVFNTNRAVPPPRPIVVDPGNQVSTIRRPVSLQLTVTPGTGVAPLTWQVTSGVLPTGLTLAADGLVSGTPTALTTSTPLTVTVSDAFGRTGTGTFAWSVVDPPTITTPVPQTSVQGQRVSLSTASTCPNSPCTFTLTGAPAGLSIDATTGVITGAATTRGTSPAVSVTITDAAGAATSTAAFTWQVLAPATIGAPGTLRATVGTAVSVPVPYSCSVGPCTVTLNGTTPGIGLSTTPSGTANNLTTTLNVAAGSGTLYLAGTPQSTAVPTGTSAGFAPTLGIADSGSTGVTSAPGAWTVFLRPTIGAVGNRNATVGATKDVALSYTCPNTPCAITLTGSVPGLGLSATSGQTTANGTTTLTVTAASGTVWINGLVSSSAVPSGTSKAYTVTATITDSAGAAATSSGTWTATTAPRLTNPGSHAIEPGDTFSLPITVDCPNGGCTFAAEVQSAGTSTWTPIPISSTGRITYTNPPTGSYTVRVTVTDADGITDTTTFTLAVQTFTLSIPNQTTTRPSSGTTLDTIDVASLVRPLAGGYTYQLSNAPPWLSISPTGLLTATVTSTTTTGRSKNISVKVSSVSGAASNVTTTFSWTIQ